jgi:aminomethyltransferase
MGESCKTVLYDKHVLLKAKMVDFGGWLMPLYYPTGIMEEHLATRRQAGLFDVSHMGRFIFRGKNVIKFLQHVLTNNAAALDLLQSQYTIIPNSAGGAIDDAYLYRFYEDEYILVVNAANIQKDWDYFQKLLKGFKDVEMIDKSKELAMLSLQGPASRTILKEVIDSGYLPEPLRNELSIAVIKGSDVLISRTGYTGEPLCFELFIGKTNAGKIWDILIEKGAVPVGLGARDTLRLEAALPLYGHELGKDPEGKEIPVFSSAQARFAVSFSPLKGDFIGKEALAKQFEAFKKILDGNYSSINDLPRIVMPVELVEKGVARAGSKVFSGDRHVGYVTSGTAIPYVKFEGNELTSKLTDEKDMRALCPALIDSNMQEGDKVEIEVRGRRIKAIVVPFFLRSEIPKYSRPVLSDYLFQEEQLPADAADYSTKTVNLLNKSIENTIWRQKECLNFIPSEQTQSPMVRLLSIMDPAFRYAEHKQVKALYDAEVFYYQGCDFIEEVEKLLEKEIRTFMGCKETETRSISGQMANTVVFSALVDYLNRGDRKREPRRIRYVLNNHMVKGGHLSGQPMGALRDFVARDPRTEKPAVVNFPVLKGNQYKIDIKAAKEIIAEYKPELIIFGKSMVIYREPVSEIRAFVDEFSPGCIIMYDMAHVFGLIGPYFQEPFKEGADIVTGSTHKTFFGTQRGVIGSNFEKLSEQYKFWEAVRRRVFPGSVSNHHLGTLLGLLMATYEMNHFKDEYQKKVLANAKAFAKALKETGLNIAGDAKDSYTETHQVIIEVGYAKGPEIARKLEENNIVVNYQATPDEEGFTASGGIRLGVSEMTRFGMKEKDFKTAAQLFHDVIVKGKTVKKEVKSLRKKFVNLGFCFSSKKFEPLIKKLHKLI